MTTSIDRIAEEMQKIRARIDYTDMHTSLDQVASIIKSGETTKLGLTLGENLGGFEALTEVAKTASEKLLVLYEPVITQMTEFVPGLEKDIKKALTSDNTTAINSIIKNGAVVSTATTVKSSMNHAVVADGSPIAIKAGAGTAIDITDTGKYESMMKEVTEDELKDTVTEAVEVLQSDELKTRLANTFKDLDTKIIKATNGLNSGSLLKDVTENFSSTFGNILGNFGSEFTTGNNTNSVLNTLLGGSNTDAINKSASIKTIPPELSREASENGISTNVKNLNDGQSFINQMVASVSGADFATLINEYRTGLDDIVTKLSSANTSVAATINDGNPPKHLIRNAEETKADSCLALEWSL